MCYQIGILDTFCVSHLLLQEEIFPCIKSELVLVKHTAVNKIYAWIYRFGKMLYPFVGTNICRITETVSLKIHNGN